MSEQGLNFGKEYIVKAFPIFSRWKFKNKNEVKKCLEARHQSMKDDGIISNCSEVKVQTLHEKKDWIGRIKDFFFWKVYINIWCWRFEPGIYFVHRYIKVSPYAEVHASFTIEPMQPVNNILINYHIKSER
jgi:hypothetical protein